jgi:molecular chaperone HtpG
MYVDPRSIYREYIQNAADSIEQSLASGLTPSGWHPRVDITMNAQERAVTIRDNGIGISRDDFVSRLTAIGASQKRGSELRGFRGVGRLSGLGYCQELVFRSRAPGESRVSTLSWDGRKLKELLRDTSNDFDLSQAIRSIARTATIPSEGWPEFFFEVELRKVARVRNDALLNDEEIRNYLSQVAPAPFNPTFKYSDELTKFLREAGVARPIDIYLGQSQTPIYRPHEDTFPVTDKISDRISGITYFEIPGLEVGVDAVGWILSHSYLGSIPKRARIDGLRMRVGNMQIGTSDIAAHVFGEPRFNSWCVGEIHVLNRRIIPNGRRDDFETNAHYQNLLGHVGGLAKELTKTCRDRSDLRNRLKQAAQLIEGIDCNIALLSNAAYSSIHKFILERTTLQIDRLESLSNKDALTPSERTFLAAKAGILRGRFTAASKGKGRSGIFDRVSPVKRKAYEDAIAVILDSPLPMNIRASLVQALGYRAAARNKTKSKR